MNVSLLQIFHKKIKLKGNTLLPTQYSSAKTLH